MITLEFLKAFMLLNTIKTTSTVDCLQSPGSTLPPDQIKSIINQSYNPCSPGGTGAPGVTPVTDPSINNNCYLSTKVECSSSGSPGSPSGPGSPYQPIQPVAPTDCLPGAASNPSPAYPPMPVAPTDCVPGAPGAPGSPSPSIPLGPTTPGPNNCYAQKCAQNAMTGGYNTVQIGGVELPAAPNIKIEQSGCATNAVPCVDKK